jgi:hypothetical protein
MNAWLRFRVRSPVLWLVGVAIAMKMDCFDHYRRRMPNSPFRGYPPNLKLCHACFMFISLDGNYWDVRLRDPEVDDRNLNWYDVFRWFKTPNGLDACPRCVVGRYILCMSEETYNDIRFGDETDDRRRKLHLELGRRIGKP